MIAKLVGKETRHVNKDTLILYQRLMYQVRMGYVNMSDPKAHQSIKYYPEEHIYDHDLSIRSIGRQYEVKKLKELIPLDIYLNYPIDITEELITGMMMGSEDRVNLERDVQEEQARKEQLAKDKAGQGFNNLHENK